MKTRKNIFGLFGSGQTRESVEKKKRSEAHKLLDQGEYRAARKVSRMSTRRYARKRGLKVEGRVTGRVRRAKQRAGSKAHGLIDRVFGGSRNPQAQLVGAKRMKVKRNQLPALLSTIGSAIEGGAGYAAGSKIVSDLTAGHKKAKKQKHPRKKHKRNPRAQYVIVDTTQKKNPSIIVDALTFAAAFKLVDVLTAKLGKKKASGLQVGKEVQ